MRPWRRPDGAKQWANDRMCPLCGTISGLCLPGDGKRCHSCNVEFGEPRPLPLEDGTEEGEEHRVMILHSSTNFRRFGVSGREVPGALLSEDNCKQIFGTSEEGAEVTTRVLSRPEPEEERVKPELFHTERTYRCPKCKCPLKEKDIHGGCCACGVLFEEAPGA